MSDIKKDIRKLLKEKNAILLAHNYQRDEVQEIADFCGDSLGLSEVARDFKAEAIIFCGVHFMAESAAILAPKKKIIMPRVDAGCPMADMITADDVEEIREERPNVPIVAYVNTSAEVKAHSDICCTSGNAINVVNSLPENEAYLIPDKNLAQYIQLGTTKKLDWWDGFCPTHEWLKVEDIEKAKEANPGSLFLCHPECNPSVVDIADHVCSTSGMYKWAKETDAKSIIVGTEMGIMYRLKKDNPEKKFILASECLCCPNMKLTTLEDIHESLINMNNIITVEEDIRLKAKATLDKMLAIPRNA